MPASVHRDLVAYAEILEQETAQPVQDPTKLIAPMLVRFIMADRFSEGDANVTLPAEASDSARIVYPRRQSGQGLHSRPSNSPRTRTDLGPCRRAAPDR
ncbi:DUF2274 domain-containing protein [Bradyrhizobium zhanjiangense]|uniref:DUF2274 domain-containing protein n=1 Tax=Bradyrhizobium zhanjiangense TaxID=1325107 RepID=UPI003D31F3AD